MSSEGRVRIVSPDGSRGTIPVGEFADDWGNETYRRYRLQSDVDSKASLLSVTKPLGQMSDIIVTSPDGKTGVIDSSLREKAIAKGWTVHDEAAAPASAAPATPGAALPYGGLAGDPSSYAALTGLPQTTPAPTPSPEPVATSPEPPTEIRYPLYNKDGTINFHRPTGQVVSIANTPELIAKATAKGWKPVGDVSLMTTLTYRKPIELLEGFLYLGGFGTLLAGAIPAIVAAWYLFLVLVGQFAEALRGDTHKGTDR